MLRYGPTLLALVIFFLSPVALATELDRPFGIEMGQKLASLRPITEFQLKKREASVLRTQKEPIDLDREVALSTVPKPHPLLSRYSVTATEAAGVCAISGFSPLAEIEIMDKTLATIEQQLSEILGPPTILPGNKSLEVTRIWFWLKAAVPDNHSPLERVSLYRFDDDGKRGAMLKFEFTNHLRCGSTVATNPFR